MIKMAVDQRIAIKFFFLQ